MRFTSVALMLVALAGHANAAEPRSADAVIAADQAWERAELSGDAAFLKKLLSPGYVSIGPDGRTTTRDKLVAHVGARTKPELVQLAQQVAVWKAAHPSRTEVSVFGDTAIVKWMSAKTADPSPVLSCDIFVYRGGRWHPIYSQHSSASS